MDPAHKISSLEEYFMKLETRLILPGTFYYPPSLNTWLSDFLQALEDDEELKKFMTIHVCFNGQFLL